MEIKPKISINKRIDKIVAWIFLCNFAMMLPTLLFMIWGNTGIGIKIIMSQVVSAFFLLLFSKVIEDEG